MSFWLCRLYCRDITINVTQTNTKKTFSFCVAPSSSRWIRSSPINERNVCTSSTDMVWLFKKRCVRSNKSCIRSFAGCADLNLVGLVSRDASKIVTILSGQSVISRVYTSRFGNSTVRLEPQPRWYYKKYQVLYPVENSPKVSRTVQWKSTNRQVLGKAQSILLDDSHPMYHEFVLLPSGIHNRTPISKTYRFKHSFIPPSLKFLNLR